jgi:hypothetical protein
MIATYRKLKTLGRLMGEVLRDSGMEAAAANREWLIRRGQLALLDAMADRDDLTATTDDATTHLIGAYADGGKWRGEVTSGLRRAGLIVRVGAVRSCRAARHAGLVTRWRGANRDAINAERDRLRAWLDANTPSRPPPKDAGQQAAPTAAAPKTRTLFD